VQGDLFHGRLPEGSAYIGRAAPGLPASRYANPHRVGRVCRRCGVEHDQAGAVAAYAGDLAEDPELVAAARRELIGDLACWCRTWPCHGDVLEAVLAGADPRQLATRDRWLDEHVSREAS
jgi:hypothetical protein